MKNNTRRIVGIGLFTAIVVVLQLLGSFIHFGVFSISLVLAPIIIGTALYGIGAGAWLGFVFGFVVLVSGDAAPFMAVNAPGTIATVLIKGVCAGLGAGLVFNLLEKKSTLAATILAGVASPVCNTGVFLIGCRLFFFETIKEWGIGAGFENVTAYMFLGLAGVNFVVELAINLVLSTVIVSVINIGKKQIKSDKK